MSPDGVSAMLRGASFIALFQAAGTSLFLALFGRPLVASSPFLRRAVLASAIAAVILTGAQFALEAARLAGDFVGLSDASLQKMALASPSGVVAALRIAGLASIAISIRREGDFAMTCGVTGAVVVCASFVLMGHTVTSPLRWLVAPLLLLHVTIVASWFGALLPLYVAAALETGAVAGAVTREFSGAAVRLVPVIFVAGLVLALVLVQRIATLTQGYGMLLLVKVSGFAFLMILAALNKWRLAPAVALGVGPGVRMFRRSLALEYALICGVLVATAAMTEMFSPEGS